MYIDNFIRISNNDVTLILKKLKIWFKTAGSIKMFFKNDNIHMFSEDNKTKIKEEIGL